MPSFRPRGPFDLANQNEYFGGWPVVGDAIVLAFPVEGWKESAAVVVRQDGADELSLEVIGDGDRARDQALAALSLDIDGGGWPEVGERDAHIRRLQETYRCLRPVLFASPYEAAAHFIIGHRISMKQGRAIRARMAEELGTTFEVEGQAVAAFPQPERLLALKEFRGLNATKVERLHGVAEAALAGTLDRAHLRSLAPDEALAEIRTIDGVGPFFAAGILNRGAGLVDEVTDDELTRHAVQVAYGETDVRSVAERWRPYRMWAVVLLHVWLRREVGLPSRRR